MDPAATAPLALDYAHLDEAASSHATRPIRLVLRTVITTILLLAIALGLLVRFNAWKLGQDLSTVITLRQLRAFAPESTITISPMQGEWLRFDVDVN